MKNFSSFPDYGGYLDVLTVNDLKYEIPNGIFKPVNNFGMLQTNKFNRGAQTFKNQSGDEYDYYDELGETGDGAPGGFSDDDGGQSWWERNVGMNLGDFIKLGGNIYSGIQQKDLADTTAEIKRQEAEIEKERAKQEKSRLEAAKIKGAAFIKSYGVPIAITGGVIIVGMVTYFLLKKKTGV